MNISHVSGEFFEAQHICYAVVILSVTSSISWHLLFDIHFLEQYLKDAC